MSSSNDSTVFFVYLRQETNFKAKFRISCKNPRRTVFSWCRKYTKTSQRIRISEALYAEPFLLNSILIYAPSVPGVPTLVTPIGYSFPGVVLCVPSLVVEKTKLWFTFEISDWSNMKISDSPKCRQTGRNYRNFAIWAKKSSSMLDFGRKFDCLPAPTPSRGDLTHKTAVMYDQMRATRLNVKGKSLALAYCCWRSLLLFCCYC